jgi:hypothetical protein
MQDRNYDYVGRPKGMVPAIGYIKDDFVIDRLDKMLSSIR